MKDTSINRVLLISSFILFAIAMVFISFYIVNYDAGSGRFFKNYNKIVDNELGELIKLQASRDEKYAELSISGDYTFDNPLVIENPYEINPLSALIIFNTKESKEVTVSINDTKITTIEAAKKHLIPIYGLYANSTNFVELRLDDNTTKTIEIKTTSYNNDLTGIDFIGDRGDTTHTFILGNMKSSNSFLRGFDTYNNLVLFMDFGYFSSIKYNIDKFYIGYNSIYSKNTNLKDLNLEIDYLGKIKSITTDVSELNYNYNAQAGDKTYSYVYKNLYEPITPNYSIKKVVDHTKYSAASVIKTKEIEDKLVNAKNFAKEYKIAINGEYITYDIQGGTNKMDLVLVTRNTDNTYSYDMSNKNMIKTNITGDVSLYINFNGTYYTLLTTINN